VVGGEEGGIGHLRGQVIALGVQTSLGRPFDAAVIELFGDAPMGSHGTRLDGVMVVDRKSGVLLRLELHSGNPEFALRHHAHHRNDRQLSGKAVARRVYAALRVSSQRLTRGAHCLCIFTTQGATP
jgi:hypothetical protein